jgi:hypothetical protein
LVTTTEDPIIVGFSTLNFFHNFGVFNLVFKQTRCIDSWLKIYY